MKLTREEKTEFDKLVNRRDVKKSTVEFMLIEINEHREALGRRPVTTKDRTKAIQHLAKINTHAKFGNDPWA